MQTTGEVQLRVLVLVLIAAASGATTDDPGQGGLFGYNPAAYERRTAEGQAAVLQETKPDR